MNWRFWEWGQPEPREEEVAMGLYLRREETPEEAFRA